MKAYKNTEAMPYERFLKYGAESLTDAELLAIILRTGTKEKNALELAGDILHLQGNMQGKLIGLHQLSLAELKSIPGIGEVKAIKVKALGELAVRMARQSLKERHKFDSPDTLAAYYMERMRHYTTECVLLVMLDNKGHMLGEHIISKGTVNASLISPREIFIKALKYDASSIVLIHNHPSGDPSPSGPDRQITKQVYECGKLMNIPLIDHIIIGDHTYSSFKELGLL
ncbi:MAG: DNA repair protein RadC [Lachnospiraceae bacterium]|nr:DNA repair protein RadC [Lachnospiraceae bacterium]MBR3761601.1 DNA repair protein RadC [Lachnospiraceae bacterium]